LVRLKLSKALIAEYNHLRVFHWLESNSLAPEK
jgi:hypothetical protein